MWPAQFFLGVIGLQQPKLHLAAIFREDSAIALLEQLKKIIMGAPLKVHLLASAAVVALLAAG
jgi:hypothetical protein